MKLASFPEAVRDYERITGETLLWSLDLDLKVLDSNEFMLWAVREREGQRYFWLDQTYGFIKNFVPFIKDICSKNNIEWLVTGTTRDPKMHIKKWSMERLPQFDYEYEGRRYFILKGHISNLR